MKEIYKELSIEDIDILLEYEEKFPNPWSKRSFEIEFEGEFNKTLALYIDGVLMSYIFYSEYLDEVNINHFATNPNYTQKGYGSKILDRLIKTMRNQLLYLEVNTLNIKAINLYKKYGLKIIRIRENYYGKGQDAYIMQKYID